MLIYLGMRASTGYYGIHVIRVHCVFAQSCSCVQSLGVHEIAWTCTYQTLSVELEPWSSFFCRSWSWDLRSLISWLRQCRSSSNSACMGEGEMEKLSCTGSEREGGGRHRGREGKGGEREREREREKERESERERERDCFGVWKYIHCTCTCIMHYRLHVHVAYSHCLLRILKLLIIYEHFISFKCHLRCVYTWSFSSLIFSYKNRILHASLIRSFTCTHSYPYNAITCTMYMYMYMYVQ